MGIEFNPLQRKTLTAIVDTFVASVPRDDDPTGFYAAKGSDLGADAAAEYYLVTHLPDEELAGLFQLIDTAGPGRVEESTPGSARGDHRQPRRHLARDRGGDRGAASAFGDVRLRPARRPGPQPLVGRDGIPGPDPGAAGKPRRHCRSSPRPARRRWRRTWSWSAPAAAVGWRPRCWRRRASG